MSEKYICLFQQIPKIKSNYTSKEKKEREEGREGDRERERGRDGGKKE